MTLLKSFTKIWEKTITDEKDLLQNISNNKEIPFSWKFLLINDGSFTRNLNIIIKQKIYLDLIKQNYNITRKHFLSQENNILYDYSHMNRTIWLTNYQGNKMAFAESSWHNNMKILNKLPTNEPIGLSFINNNTEIHRRIINIYYGYSQILENQFQAQGPMWGRSYYIFYQNMPIVLINEIFSSNLIHKLHTYRDIQPF